MKKVFALVLALVLMMSAAAIAEEAIGSPVPAEITNCEPDVGATLKTAETDETLKALVDAIANNDAATVFASAGVENIAKYELVDLVGLEFANYTEGEVKLTVKFAAAFEQDADILVLLGLINGNEVAWQNLAAEIAEDGSLVLSFTAEQAKAVAEGQAVVAVLQAIAE